MSEGDTIPADFDSMIAKVIAYGRDRDEALGRLRRAMAETSVVIEGGRIVSATIAQCLTRYSCSWIADLPPQVVKRQSPEVDYVSGATQSTNAFYYGIVEALAKAK